MNSQPNPMHYDDSEASTDSDLRMAELQGIVAAIDKSQAMIEFSLDGRILHANANFCGAMGYSLDEIKGQHHSLFVEPAYRDSLEYKAFWAKLGRGEFDAAQYKRIGKGGKEIWIQASYNPVFDASGKPCKVVKFATDITAEKMREADQQGQIDAVSKSQAVISFDLSGKILHANDNFLSAMGYTLSELQGQHHSIFVEPGYRDSAEYKDFWAKLGRGEFDAAQYKRIGKGGKEIWIQASYNPILDPSGKPYKVVKFATDITQQVAAARENLRIKNALDNVSSNVMIADNERNIVYLNRSVSETMIAAESDLRRELPHFDARRLLGAKIDVFHKNPEHQKRMLESLTQAYTTQIKVGGRTFRLGANPIVSESGERVGSVVEWADRTAEVAVEDEVARIVQAAVEGDYSLRLSTEGKKGFFLQLAEGINGLLENSANALEDIRRILAALSSGDLTQSIDADYGGTLGQIKDDANATVAQLTQIISQIKDSTDTINTAAGEIASGNADLSQRTEEQAASLEETASSMEELTSTVRQNAENARTANQLAIGAADVAGKGGDVVSQVVTTMSAITESSKKIVDIISVIDGIAFQTNILALNAAVEAARAGEQGRGFAVVASEVRSLAQRSAGAAKEIKSLIGDSVEKVEDGSALVAQAGKTMSEIVTSVKRVTDIMAEISAASQEQSAGIEQVNTTITQMDEVTQQNAALVEEASAAARSLEEQAGGLTEVVSRFVLSADPVAAPPQPSRVQRQAPSRPSARPVAARSPAPANPRVVTPRARSGAANGSGDQNWQEF
ncbi:MAG: methyl-accepting chemotaxis protein [Xanthomonadaceae bacterium]|nr:methyl-accepting chemotaxis protein [Xanthomonadaceae bacterium]